MRTILLDIGPLGMLSNPRSSSENDACREVVAGLIAKGDKVCLPEIADYELRRELLRADRRAGLLRLDALRNVLEYLPLGTETMKLAARLWADARNAGKPTASDDALDGDVILAAQARLLQEYEYEVIVATTNVGHLSRFVDARLWSALDG